jgi:peptidoglycan/xylan/chitin deacetylase (PgdA/CDA1 family)
MKHRLKLWLRDAYARVLWYSGLFRLVDRLLPRRLTILAGHCVDHPASNAGLPADMKIRARRLEELLAGLGRHFDLVTVGEGFRRLSQGEAGASRASMVALSMDDGYRDNHEVLPALLERVGAPATLFLESRALDERRLNWTHRYFWLQERLGAEILARRILDRTRDAPLETKLGELLEAGRELEYRVKLALKYDAERDDRERVLDELFADEQGDERALCETLYMDWPQARALVGKGFELGGHTVSHSILSRLDPGRQAEEVRGGRDALAREVGEAATFSFAYPFGRRWDFDDRSAAAVRDAGFQLAVTTHPGTNTSSSDPYRLARWMIDDGTPLYLLGCEAAGGFELLRRLGLELAE